MTGEEAIQILDVKASWWAWGGAGRGGAGRGGTSCVHHAGNTKKRKAVSGAATHKKLRTAADAT